MALFGLKHIIETAIHFCILVITITIIITITIMMIMIICCCSCSCSCSCRSSFVVSLFSCGLIRLLFLSVRPPNGPIQVFIRVWLFQCFILTPHVVFCHLDINKKRCYQDLPWHCSHFKPLLPEGEGGDCKPEDWESAVCLIYKRIDTSLTRM